MKSAKQTIDAPIARKFPVSLINNIIDYLKETGLSSKELLRVSQLVETQLIDPTQYLPLHHLELLICYAYKCSNDPLIHLNFLPSITPSAFGVVGHLMYLSGSLAKAIELLQSYQALIGSIGIITLRHEPGRAYWGWDCQSDNPVFRQCSTECNLGFWSMLTRLIRTNGTSPLLAVHFIHEPPSDKNLLSTYERIFGCPVFFNQSESALIIAGAALNLPLKTENPGLQQTLEAYASNLLKQQSITPTITERVSTRIRTLLFKGGVSREVIATQLGINVRTLSRQLNHEGTSFRKILDEVRLEAAKNYLQSTEYSIEKISELVNFQASHSFISWFRKHTNYTPNQYKKYYSHCSS